MSRNDADPEHLLWRVSTAALKRVSQFVMPINPMDGVTTTSFDDALCSASEPSHLTSRMLPTEQFDALFLDKETPAGYPFFLPEYPTKTARAFSALEGLFRAQLPGGALNAAGSDALFPKELIFSSVHKAFAEDEGNRYPSLAGHMDRFYPFHFTSFYLYSTVSKTIASVCLCGASAVFIGLSIVNPVMEGPNVGPVVVTSTMVAVSLLACVTMAVFLSIAFDILSAVTFSLAPAAIRRQRDHNGDNSISSLLKAGTIAYNQTLSTVVEPLVTWGVVLCALYYRLIVQDYQPRGNSTPAVVPSSLLISQEVLLTGLVGYVASHALSLTACRQWVEPTMPTLLESGGAASQEGETQFVDARIEPRLSELLRTPDVEVVSESDGESVKLRLVPTTFQKMWEGGGSKSSTGSIELPRPGGFSDGIRRSASTHVDSIRSVVIPIAHKLMFLVVMLLLFLFDSSSLSRQRPIQLGTHMFIWWAAYSLLGLCLMLWTVIGIRLDFWSAASGWRRAQLEWMTGRILNISPLVLRRNVFSNPCLSKSSFGICGGVLALHFAALRAVSDVTPVKSGFSWLLPGLAFSMMCLGLATIILIVAIVQCGGAICCITQVARATGTPLFRPVVHAFLDGVYDLCHVGHKKMFHHALDIADRVLVGTMSDEDCLSYKRKPITTTGERMREILNCNINIGGRAVFRVLPHSPNKGLPVHFLLQYGVSKVVMGQEYVKDSDFYYIAARLLAQIACVAPRTSGISTSDIIRRIQAIPITKK